MTKGAEGEAPEEYNMIQAARYWGVPPWELMRESRYWVQVAEYLSQAEAHLEEAQGKIHKRKATRSRR